MALHRPRRLFRSESSRFGENLIGRVIAIGLGLASFVGMLMIALPADLFGRASAIATTISAESPQVAVIDGDTLRLRDTLIRLQGINAPTRGKICQQPGGAEFDCGEASGRALAALVRGRAVSCQIDRRDRRGFAQAHCDAGGIDLGRAMVSSGWATASPAISELVIAETEARQHGLGLWQVSPPAKP